MPHPTQTSAADQQPITVTLDVCTRRTSLSRSTLYRLEKDGKIIMRKAGRSTLVVWRSVLDYLDGCPTIADARIKKARNDNAPPPPPDAA